MPITRQAARTLPTSAATANTVDEGVQQVILRHGDASLLQPPQRDAQGVPENCATPW
jgi:hypothetical protein